jgi:hypothetical protein
MQPDQQRCPHRERAHDGRRVLLAAAAAVRRIERPIAGRHTSHTAVQPAVSQDAERETLPLIGMTRSERARKRSNRSPNVPTLNSQTSGRSATASRLALMKSSPSDIHLWLKTELPQMTAS